MSGKKGRCKDGIGWDGTTARTFRTACSLFLGLLLLPSPVHADNATFLLSHASPISRFPTPLLAPTIRYGIAYNILSLTAPGIQGEPGCTRAPSSTIFCFATEECPAAICVRPSRRCSLPRNAS